MEANWGIFFLLAIIVKVLFPGLSLFCYIAVMASLHQFMLLFTFIGYIIPVRYLFGAFMCLQFFIGPVLAYNGMDQYQYVIYRMQVPEGQYFAYALPAVLSFILGLHISAGNFKGEIVNEDGVALFVKKNPGIPYTFIIVGFCASVVSAFFSSDLAFVFYIIGNLKFVGLFMLVIGSAELKVGPLVLVIGSIVASSLGQGMFHDLLTWLLFVGAIFAIKYKFGFSVKLIACSAFILLALIIQLLKTDYRAAINTQGGGSIETFTGTYNNDVKDNTPLFSFDNLAPNVVRINQGFIITNIMKTVPDKVPFSNGDEMGQILEAAIMPRAFDQNKLKAGDREIFQKYSGVHLRAGTSMGLGSLGDAYLNFDVFGGSVFMFFLGFTYCLVLNHFNKRSLKQPVLILFLPIIFYYPIRPDCELQTILGHLVKATFIILAMVYFWKTVFRDDEPEEVAAFKKAKYATDALTT
jgi:hypothetical protein